MSSVTPRGSNSPITDNGNNTENNVQDRSEKNSIKNRNQKNSDINRIHNNDPNEIHNNNPNYQSNIDSRITSNRALETQRLGSKQPEKKGEESFYTQLQRYREGVALLNSKSNRAIITDPKTARFVIDLISVLEKKKKFGYKYNFTDFTDKEIESIRNKNDKINNSGIGPVNYNKQESELLLLLIDMYQNAYKTFDNAMEYMAHYENESDGSELKHRFKEFCRVKGDQFLLDNTSNNISSENLLLNLRGEVLAKCLDYMEAGILDLYLNDLINVPEKFSDNSLINEDEEKVGDPGDIRRGGMNRIVDKPVNETSQEFLQDFCANWNDDVFVISTRMDLENALTMRLQVLEKLLETENVLQTEAEQNRVGELQRERVNVLECLIELFGS